MGGRYRLNGGTHTRPNGDTIHAGQTFEPTEDELEGPLRGRVSRARSVKGWDPNGWERIFGGNGDGDREA